MGNNFWFNLVIYIETCYMVKLKFIKHDHVLDHGWLVYHCPTCSKLDLVFPRCNCLTSCLSLPIYSHIWGIVRSYLPYFFIHKTSMHREKNSRHKQFLWHEKYMFKINFVEWLSDYNWVLIPAFYTCLHTPSDRVIHGTMWLFTNLPCAWTFRWCRCPKITWFAWPWRWALRLDLDAMKMLLLLFSVWSC
jgi:hypothetical protein